MAATFLNIPGNIKQKNLPFVLSPSNSINTTPIDIADENGKKKSQVDCNGAEAQMFSFKPSKFGGSDGGASAEEAGFLRIAPNSFYNENTVINKVSYTKPDKDLSYKLLYPNEMRDNKKQSANMHNILTSLPSITVREYLQDSKLNNVLNLFSSIIGGWDEGTKLAKEAEESSNQNFFQKLWKFAPSLVQKLPKMLQAAAEDVNVINQLDFAGGSGNEKDYIMKIPFALYYRMISATTTNIYQLPYNGKIMYESDGTKGWNVDNGLGGFSTEGNSIVGKILNYVGGNVKVNTTPTWTPKDAAAPTKMELVFDLYNDSIDGALKNFIFINTIIPGNKFLQYHIYQHAPNLYDIRIDGVNRLFMCSAMFKVEALGVQRIPSKKFLTRLIEKHKNNGFSITDATKLSKYIRIPDIYRVTMNAESLLPDSFNNYIYQYYINSPITSISGNDLHIGSAYEEFAQNISKNVAYLWNNPDYEGGFGENDIEDYERSKAEAKQMGAADMSGEGYDYENS